MIIAVVHQAHVKYIAKFTLDPCMYDVRVCTISDLVNFDIYIGSLLAKRTKAKFPILYSAPKPWQLHVSVKSRISKFICPFVRLFVFFKCVALYGLALSTTVSPVVLLLSADSRNAPERVPRQARDFSCHGTLAHYKNRLVSHAMHFLRFHRSEAV